MPWRTSMGKPCEICLQAESKYRCPRCRASYCSVACYKTHKDGDQCDAFLAARAKEDDKKVCSPVGIFAQTADQTLPSEDEGYRVSPDQIDRMVESKRLQELLRDPRIREVVELIDAAQDRERALDGAIENNREFADFVQALAETINPEGAPT